MTNEDALKWVQENSRAIIGRIKRRLLYCPYDTEDLISCANQAALIAVSVAAKIPHIKFEKVFWSRYRSIIREIIPQPGNHRWSQSIPSDVCDAFEEDIPRIDETHIALNRPSCVPLKSESVYYAVVPYLTENEKRFIYAILGLSRSGYHTVEEAGNILGISEPSAWAMLQRLTKKITRLFAMQLAVVSPSRAIPIRHEPTITEKRMTA